MQEYGFFRNTFSFVSGTAYTISCFFKPDQITRVSISAGNVALLPINAIFDLTGSGSIVGTPTGTASIQQFSNGWYRCSVSATALLSGITSVRFSAVSGTSTSYAGNSVDSFFAWGAQLEAGNFPTSYIPTTTASVVRSADICSITGAAFTSFYNQSEGTIVGSGLTNALTTNAGPELFRSNDGTTNNRVQVGITNFPLQAVRPFIVASGTATYTNAQGTATVGVERKVGVAYKTNDAISAFNGTLGTLDTTVTPPTNCNQVALFSGLGAGTISSFRYYKKRLSDAKLQALTV
jgi:hypothetical protein